MIKLFWNTHNQLKPNIKDKDTKDSINYRWGLYHKNYSDKWIYEILKKINYKLINDFSDIENNDMLIIIDSSIEKKKELYSKLKLICSKIFLIHLGDEAGIHDISSIYENCNFILRTFCSNKYFRNEKVRCIPIGYKTGIFKKNQKIRKYKWAFVGTPHKSSRHDLLFQLSCIEPSFCHKTEKFNTKIISVNEMSEVFSSTEFIPCPHGFVHPETYRLYEALECGCIPIVENAYNYYDRLYPNNPFLKIDKWTEAKSIIKNWEYKKINIKKKECEMWWAEYKKQLQESITKIVN